MIVYRGTSRINVEAILRDGFPDNSYFTTNDRLARMFAETAYLNAVDRLRVPGKALMLDSATADQYRPVLFRIDMVRHDADAARRGDDRRSVRADHTWPHQQADRSRMGSLRKGRPSQSRHRSMLRPPRHAPAGP
jgi:hypothetical protein